MSEIALKKSESGVPKTEELGRIFEFNNFNYFDVFQIFKGFNENLEDMNIIAGAELFKIKVEIKKQIESWGYLFDNKYSFGKDVISSRRSS